MPPSVLKPPYTVDEFLALPDDRHRWELYDGLPVLHSGEWPFGVGLD